MKNIAKYAGRVNWNEIAELMNVKFPNKNRSGKQLRERFINYSKFFENCTELFVWKAEEVDTLYSMFEKIGPSWIRIAESLPGKY